MLFGLGIVLRIGDICIIETCPSRDGSKLQAAIGDSATTAGRLLKSHFPLESLRVAS
jgi:hypothetical protein